MKKRRAEAAGLDDAERNLHPSFCAAANAISHLYTQALAQHKIAFQAGQRCALEKLCEWMQEQHRRFGSLPTTFDILNSLKNELENISQAEMMISRMQSAPPPLQTCQTATLFSSESTESPMD